MDRVQRRQTQANAEKKQFKQKHGHVIRGSLQRVPEPDPNGRVRKHKNLVTIGAGRAKQV